MSLYDQIKEYDNLNTCAANLTHFIPIEKFELSQTKENQIILYDLKYNKTHYSTDFCIDTRYYSFSSFNVSKTYAKVCQSLCANESSICVQFCCPKGEFAMKGIFSECVPYKFKNDNTDWKPKPLIDAEEIGLGRALYNRIPNCPDFFIDSYDTNHPVDILENGYLDWGKEFDFEDHLPCFNETPF